MTVKKTTVFEETTSTILTTWEDEKGNPIVAGEKQVKGGRKEAGDVGRVFSEDLRRNFKERFPKPKEPDPREMFPGGGSTR